MIPAINQGTLIDNRYLIQKLLGQGGFGRTYLAFDNQRFGETCVLKEFVPPTYREDKLQKCRELFEREAKILYQINHPQVPKFLARLADGQRVFIVQEYIDGKTYSEILSSRLNQTAKAFSETEVRKWLTDILPVLEYLHGQNIVHRDISLDNVMLKHNQSKPVLIDFGIAKDTFTQIPSDFLNIHYSVRNSIVGKIGYSPPEQLRWGYSYPSSDIYSLAICAVVLLSGKMPHMLVDESLNWQWQSQVNISNYFASILEKMLAKIPSERYQSPTEIIRLLNNLHNNSHLVADAVPIKDTLTEKVNISMPNHQQVVDHDLEELIILQKLEKTLLEYNKLNSELPLQQFTGFKQQFLEICRQELTNIIGPIASIVIEHTVKKYSNFIPNQLLVDLAAKIPNQEKAQHFKEAIYNQPLANFILLLSKE
ncbi:hypothetical protein DSM106972_093960 [Dulcicalothrix desertica PCC 7102]|uniref:non-specific serine/threonine protein kinase n=1 Tax=Dulcicalothrix desertica PCC 7102 TaxID=232991 RepID=A0A3S1BZE9_9CYAN|nr:serine/threonine-protein kinase [Dulcicalothrix desertica]RUS94199.1 hypothetical protein DSM106972_093960 [Dulcicalothrix desertica PCC 7102]TWH53354.1 serine/threonine-protein kinase [Dulcicalothrix desertica PCC 7102]